MTASSCAETAAVPRLSWRTLQQGVEFASLPAGKMASGAPGRLYIVRVDPALARVTVGLASEAHGKSRTAAEWCRTSGFSVAINAGMFQNDQLSNVGYLRHGQHANNARWNDYRSAVAIGPPSGTPHAVLWLDLDDPAARQRAISYEIVIQNLRLMTGDRRNVWSQSPRQWSEAALGFDKQGRLLFLFTMAPYAMRDFVDLILQLPLDAAGAMHLEGGPEASLSIHAGGVDLDLAGSYETGFWSDDSNTRQWSIPNVIGVSRSH
jgi:hypothetical protein